MKSISIRMPEERLDWLRVKTAKETVKRNRSVSNNALEVEILAEAMQADKKKGG